VLNINYKFAMATKKESKEINDPHKTLIKNIDGFITQAVGGTIMAVVRINLKKEFKDSQLNIDDKTIKIMFYRYLNMCWHSYNKKTDLVVEKGITNMLNLNIIKGSVCMFNWLKTIGDVVIETIKFEQVVNELKITKDIDKLRSNVFMNISNMYNTKINGCLVNINCSGDCKNNYDGTDFITIKKL